MVKFALITGCSKGGIGDALALEFHQKQIKVIATARDLKKVQHLKDLGIDTLQLDVTSDESVKEAVSAVHKMTGGRLDFLVNNSGAGIFRPLHIDVAKVISSEFRIFYASLGQQD
jgi:1-acylglycerone phosphate reductase